MPLPQQVVEQLGTQPAASSRTLASGALLFSIGILAIVAALYVGIVFGYEPYLNKQITAIKDQAAQASASVSADQEAQLVNFYSQITNLQSILSNHVYASQLLGWLENNTEANIYYQGMDFTSGDRVSLKGVAKTEADVNQQVAIFESSPDVTSAVVSNIAPASGASGIAFTVALTLKPSVLSSKTP